MTSDVYLQQLLRRITAPTGPYGPGPRTRDALYPLISRWATTQLADVKLSGSYAKGTAVVGGTDVDLFISLKANTSQTLKEIYNSLATHLTAAGYSVRRQNVSIGITSGALKVDLTPGKKQDEYSGDHSLWVSRRNTWQKTNVDTHVAVIGGSGHTDTIRLVKRWRQIHNLEFLSFALELAVLRALSGRYFGGPASRLWACFEFSSRHLADGDAGGPRQYQQQRGR